MFENFRTQKLNKYKNYINYHDTNLNNQILLRISIFNTLESRPFIIFNSRFRQKDINTTKHILEK